MALDEKLLDRFGREILPGKKVLFYDHYSNLQTGVIRKINNYNIIIDGPFGARIFRIYKRDAFMIILDDTVTNGKL